MNEIAWVIACLILSLPAGFKQTANSKETSPLLNIPGARATETYAAWEGSEGKSVHVFWWDPSPPRDGGPIVAEREWDETVAGETARVIETKMFFGQPQRVLVTHLHPKGCRGVGMVYAQGMSQEEFSRVLAKIQLKKK